MANSFNVGDKAYIVDNALFLREVKLLRVTKDLCVIRYVESGAAIRIRKSRLFASEQEAINSTPKKILPKANHSKMTHWEYEMTHIR